MSNKYIIFLTNTYPNTRDTNIIKAENRNITGSQRKTLEKGRKMAKIVKSKLGRKNNFNTTWLVTTIKRLVIKSVKKIGKPVFSFKQTQEATKENIQILAALNGNLGSEIDAQNGSLLNYGSEFWDINGIKKLLRYHEDKERIVDIIQKG